MICATALISCQVCTADRGGPSIPGMGSISRVQPNATVEKLLLCHFHPGPRAILVGRGAATVHVLSVRNPVRLI